MIRLLMWLYDLTGFFVDFRDGYRTARQISDTARRFERIRELGAGKAKIKVPAEITGYMVGHCVESAVSRAYKAGSKLYFMLNKEDVDLMEKFGSSLKPRKKIRGLNS